VSRFAFKRKGAQRGARVDVVPSVAEHERELRRYLASGRIPDADVAAFTDPANRASLQAYVEAMQHLKVTIVAFGFEIDDAELLILALQRFVSARRVIEAAAVASYVRQNEIAST
jgi:hypothetical protein